MWLHDTVEADKIGEGVSLRSNELGTKGSPSQPDMVYGECLFQYTRGLKVF